MTRVLPSMIVDLIDQIGVPVQAHGLRISHQSVAGLAGVVNLIEKLPNELITISGRDYGDLILGIEAIRNSIAIWQRKGGSDISMSSIRGYNALLLLRNALKKCPDQIPSPMTVELLFVDEEDLRNDIRLDISTATNALHNGEWKAVAVLAGSVGEALLLWAIKKKPTYSNMDIAPKKDIMRWNFIEYIDVAEGLGLIKENTSQLARMAKDFRNLIHPGRVERLNIVCDRGAALTALAAVESIVRDLSSYHFPIETTR